MIRGVSVERHTDFSVVVPLHDKRAFVGAALASVLVQTVMPREVIVVDDGSTDGGDVLVEAMHDDRIRLIHQANAGPGAARNTGFAAAQGAWVALIDADDLWRCDHLANLAAVIAAHPAADAVGAASLAFTTTAAISLHPDASAPRMTCEIDFFRDHRENLFNASSIAFRRSAFAATSRFGGSAAGEDMEFWIRFALDHRIAVSTAPTAFYRRGNGGIMDREQARMARGETVSVSPIFATLDAAIRDTEGLGPAPSARGAVIRGYADRTRIGYARSLVYHGRGAAARRLLAGVTAWTTPRVALTMLSLVPGPVLRRIARSYSAIKRWPR